MTEKDTQPDRRIYPMNKWEFANRMMEVALIFVFGMLFGVVFTLVQLHKEGIINLVQF